MRKFTFFFALGMAVLFCAQQAQARTIDLSTETSGDGHIRLQDGDVLTGTLTNPLQIYPAVSNCTITLDGVTINGVDDPLYDYAGIAFPQNIDNYVTIILKGTNIISGHYRVFPGIFVGKGNTLTIEGDGTLIVKSNGSAPAIGAADRLGVQYEAGNIIINGGTIQATGGHFSAAIGGTQQINCGDITINGGNITAIGGNYAPAIGSGYQAACGNITINNDGYAPLNLQANKGSYTSYSIGAADKGTCGTIIICGKRYPDGVTDNPFTCKSWDGNLANVNSEVTACNGITIRGTLSTKNKINIADGAAVNLKDATISCTEDYSCAGLNCLGDAKIILQGTNTVKGFRAGYPGIHVPKSKTLIIEGEGSLSASSKDQGAGIGGGSALDCGYIILNGGTITATGGRRSAGIGGGPNHSCGDIVISECVTKVTATKGPDAPYSVGRGKDGTCGIILIGADCEEFNGSSQNSGIEESPFVYPYECAVPQGLQWVGEIGEQSFRVIWNAGNSTEWELGLRRANSGYDYNIKSVYVTPDFTFDDWWLDADTEYEIIVRGLCKSYGVDLWSDWSEPIYVKTKASSEGVEDVQDGDIQRKKLFRNNQFLILRGDRIYTLTGQEVK